MAIKDLIRFVMNHPLTRGDPVSAVCRIVYWQARSRFADEITVGWVENSKLVVRRGMTGATGNIYAGLHEFPDMAFVLHFLRPGDLFFDVGANIGSYTVLASAVCGATTFAFEPDPGTARALQRNIHANDIGDRVTVRVTAVGSREGSALLTTGRDTMNRIAGESGRETQTVSLTTLDIESRDLCPTFLKIDIEGYEEEALQGARSLLADHRLLAIEIETVTPVSRSLLLENGFARFYYDPMLRRLTEEPMHPAHNQLWLRNPDRVQEIVASGPPVTVLGVTF